MNFTLLESQLSLNGKANFVVDGRLETQKQQKNKEAKLQLGCFDIDSKIDYHCKILIVLAFSDAFEKLAKLYYLWVAFFEL